MRSTLLKLGIGLGLATVIISCSREDSETSVSPATVTSEMVSKPPMTPEQINGEIEQSLRDKGSFNWKQTTPFFLWSATQRGDNLVSIGFGDSKSDFDRSKQPQNAKMQQGILDLIMEFEGASADKIVVQSDPYLNTMDVVIKKQETIIALRHAAHIRYVEPGNYRYFMYAGSLERHTETSSGGTSSGCGFDAETISAADYTAITPNAKAAWTLYQHNIPNAWTSSTGAGVTVGIIDTGVSPNQTLLGSSFNNGLSSGRTIQKFGAYVDSVWPWSTTTDGPADQCGHGTSMSSALGAPRNDRGLPVGVAYNANLVVYRAASNVVLDGYHEQNGVKNAFTALANNASVKIISMSMGHIFSVGKIEDGVKYAYSKGKLIFCAGGTSTSFTTFVGVIFPASMAETVAVTGVKEGITMVKCDDCHSGGKIEFTVVMQRAATGNTVPVDSYYDNQGDYVGGSSVATATTSGMAALVWSKYPTWTRDQILARLRSSASFYPNRNGEFGYGNINAQLAVQ